MKVMLLVMDEQRVILDHLYEMIKANCDQCDIYRLSKAQQLHLGRFFQSNSYLNYDRVVIFSRLKRLVGQLNVLRCIPGLIFLEHDACQNYMQFSKYRGKYSAFYRRLPWARVLCSGAVVARKLQDEGVDAVFVPKGYDETMLKNFQLPREIPVGFLGSLKGIAYTERKQILEQISDRTGMIIRRTKSGTEYLEALNRIQIFVSADVGMGEYMIKNFEAMACGCVLVAWRQDDEEVSALGLHDMKNLVLYRSVDEAVAKIKMLQADPDLAERIAQSGQALAQERYTFSRVGQALAQAIVEPMRPWPGVSSLRRFWVGLRYQLKVPGA
ncbi:glycosyltransferase [Pseudomonas corrugata]|uniref:glycosyltransferase n=1 Tax=Pseudomonas corrugata TaxID=47879 RepID=UPI00222F128F|nr:glycosyltransferase [Pseudomonas corrugata]UZD95932.1 glycosyltransferase [Pseudomonas corrugata]